MQDAGLRPTFLIYKTYEKNRRRALAFPITLRNKSRSQVFIRLYDNNRGRRPKPTQSSATLVSSRNHGGNPPRRFRNAERGRNMKLNYKMWMGMLLLAGL